jgi:hypothetical protein
LSNHHRYTICRGSRVTRAATLAVLAITVSACEDLNWPFHRARSSSSSAPADASSGGNQASGDMNSECADLLAQIRDSQETRREAPTTSINPDIVDASQGKADKRIDDLQQRYEELDCPAADAAANRPGRQPPLQPAPGAINR